MTLLNSRLNKSLSNACFYEKINGVNKKKGIKLLADCIITRELLNYKSWNEQDIALRTESLIALMSEMWDIKISSTVIQDIVLSYPKPGQNDYDVIGHNSSRTNNRVDNSVLTLASDPSLFENETKGTKMQFRMSIKLQECVTNNGGELTGDRCCYGSMADCFRCILVCLYENGYNLKAFEHPDVSDKDVFKRRVELNNELYINTNSSNPSKIKFLRKVFDYFKLGYECVEFSIL